MDNWFNSHSLQCKFKSAEILSMGTVRSNRITGCVLENDKLEHNIKKKKSI